VTATSTQCVVNPNFVIPHCGVGPLVFGMTRPAVLLAVGEPDDRLTTQGLGGAGEEWRYGSLGLGLDFHAQFDWRLCSMTVHGHSSLRGVDLVGCPVLDLERLTKSAGIPDLRRDNAGDEFGIAYTSDQFSLMLWAVDGIVDNFTVFPEYDEIGNEPVWPQVEAPVAGR